MRASKSITMSDSPRPRKLRPNTPYTPEQRLACKMGRFRQASVSVRPEFYTQLREWCAARRLSMADVVAGIVARDIGGREWGDLQEALGTDA